MSARCHAGFTLIELAIVMVIVAFLVSGAILPLTTSIERARINDTREQLRQGIRLAILGYAASRPPGTVYLPCPDCRVAAGGCAGFTANDGLEDRAGNLCATTVGNLPWVTLGAGEADVWGSRFGYGVQPTFASSNPGFTLTNPDLTGTGTDLTVRVTTAGAPLVGGVAGAEGAVAVVWSAGKNRFGAISEQGVAQPPPPAANLDELENADGDVDYVSRPLDLSGNLQQFDDLLIWISAPQARGFMVEAGRLP